MNFQGDVRILQYFGCNALNLPIHWPFVIVAMRRAVASVAAAFGVNVNRKSVQVSPLPFDDWQMRRGSAHFFGSSRCRCQIDA